MSYCDDFSNRETWLRFGQYLHDQFEVMSLEEAVTFADQLLKEEKYNG